MQTKLLAIGLAMLLSACLATVDNQFQNDFPVGKVVQDKVTMPQGDGVLPPGDWTVLANELYRNNNYHPFGNMVLGRIDDQKFLRGFITISSPLSVPIRYSFYSSSFCNPNVTLLYHQTNANVDLGNQSCFSVKKKTISAFANFDDFVKVGTSNLYAMDVDRPYDMISAEFRITRRNKFLVVEYGFDYRQDAAKMAPGYETGEEISLPRAFSPKEKTENAEAVIRWARANAERIETEFLD